MKRAPSRLRATLAIARVLLCFASLAACDARSKRASEGSNDREVRLGPEAPLFCQRPGDDLVRSLFCTEAPPVVDSLETLQRLLNVGPNALGGYDGAGSATAIYRSYADTQVLLGHSTALSGRLVTSINPRALLLGDGRALAYQRGVQQVEIAVMGGDTGRFNFYLLSFEQACNQQPQGCVPGDLYTPRVERDWLRVSVRDAEQLKNTPLDCRQCHERNRDRPTLLMRELQAPWTHYFAGAGEQPEGEPPVGGEGLVQDYLAAKGDERYAALDAVWIKSTVGFELEQIVPRNQPLLFDAPTIAAERFPYGPDGYPSTPQPSPTWEAAYEAFKRGEQLALPYLEMRATDPDKLAKLSAAYQQYRSGILPAEQLPDLSDAFPDDPMLRARIGLSTEPDATPAQLLVQACGSCHNDVLDQTITRARFNIDLTRMDREELDRAIDRVERAHDAEGAMPPPEFRQLDPEGRARLVDYLRKGDVSPDDAALLVRAAELGMAGGGSDVTFATVR